MAGFTRPEWEKSRATQSSALLSFPTQPLPHSILLQFKKYDYANLKPGGSNDTSADTSYQSLTSGLYKNLSNRKAQVKGQDSIELPFPKDLTDAQGVKIQGFERSFISEKLSTFVAGLTGAGSIGDSTAAGQAAAASAAGKAQQVFDLLSGAGRNLASAEGREKLKTQVGSILGTSGETAGQVMSYMMRNFSGDIGRALGAAGGAIVNPNETLAFEGVDLKSYTFSWDLFPENESDSKMIQQIVKSLKQNILPKFGSITEIEGLNRALLTYPSVCYLQLIGVDPSHWPKFKPCLISNVTVNYANGGQVAILKGGKPAAVNLSIAFNELTIHTQEDYAGEIEGNPVAEIENPTEEPTG